MATRSSVISPVRRRVRRLPAWRSCRPVLRATRTPRSGVSGPQAASTVASPGTFQRAFGGVFDDLAARSHVLAALAPTSTAADAAAPAATDDATAPAPAAAGTAAGAPTAAGASAPAATGDASAPAATDASAPATADHAVRIERATNGPTIWKVSGQDLARIDEITVDRTPNAEHPLVLDVDGGGRAVRLAVRLAVSGAGRAAVLWNVVNAPRVTVAEPLVGSLLAPTSGVEIDADVSGTVVAASLEQRAGSVGGTPFSAALPKTTDTGAPSSTTGAPTTGAPSSAAIPASTPLTVPPATGTNAVITVKVGGTATSSNAVTGLAGVTLQLFDGTASGPTTPSAGFAPCVSDADGDCNFTIPNTEATGVNRDRQFWVVRTGSPTGWFGLGTLVTGATAGPFTSTQYRFRTGAQLRAGTVYASSGTNASFMLGTGNTTAVASGGIWQTSRNNPSLPSRCGLNVALVLDLSGSVSSSLPDLKTAAKTFTNSLVGTPSQLALFTFSNTAPAPGTNNQNRPITPVSTQAGANTVNGWIDGLSAGGTTNWDQGLFQVAASASHFDVAVVITDGNPTAYGNPTQGPGSFTRFREVENGIFSANAVKAKSTRMIAVGVGSGVSGAADNLEAISGVTRNSDFYQSSDYTAAGNALRALALGACQGTISVIKQVVPSTAPPGTTTGAVPAGGWQFGASTTATGVTITPASGSTDASSGAVSFWPHLPGGDDHGGRDAERDPAGRLHPPTAERAQRHLYTTGYRRRGHGRELRHDRVHRRRRDHVPRQLHGVQPRPDPVRVGRGQQEVGHQRPALRRRHAADRLLGRCSPSAARPRPGASPAAGCSRARRRRSTSRSRSLDASAS